MAASRIRWAFDGTLMYQYVPSPFVKYPVISSDKYILDGDKYTLNFVYISGGVSVLWNFPCGIQIEKIIGRFGDPNTDGIFEISNDSTDGNDGSWTTVNSDVIVPETDQTFVFSPVQTAIWLRGTHYWNTTRGINWVHIYGMYQSPLFEFWNDGESAELTADYPLSLANAPNDADYAGSLNFKLKNTDSGTHSYSLTIVPVKYNADAIITDHFTLSVDGGSTKLSTVTVSSLGAGNFSGSIGIYGDVTKAHNPTNGLHYFAVHVTVTA